MVDWMDLFDLGLSDIVVLLVCPQFHARSRVGHFCFLAIWILKPPKQYRAYLFISANN